MGAEARHALLLQPDRLLGTPEEMERFDFGRLHLDAHDFAGAIGALAGVAIIPARNNRVLGLFHLGGIDDALSGFMDAWRRDPDNLFALGWALRLCLYRGDEVGAKGRGVPLAQAQGRRTEHAQVQIASLLSIHDNGAAWDVFERSSKCDCTEREAGALGAGLIHLGACAASRLRRGDQARGIWKKALDMHPRLLAAGNRATLERDRAPRPARSWSIRATSYPSAGSVPGATPVRKVWKPGSRN